MKEWEPEKPQPEKIPAREVERKLKSIIPQNDEERAIQEAEKKVRAEMIQDTMKKRKVTEEQAQRIVDGKTTQNKSGNIRIESEKPPGTPPKEWDTEPVSLGGFQSEAIPLPLDKFPGVVGDMVEAVLQTYRQPPDLIACCALGVLSIATRNTFKVEIKRDHKQHTNLYFMCALPPGGGKTPVLKAFHSPLVEWQKEARETWQVELARWKRREGIVESRTKAIRRKCEKVEMESLDIQKFEKDMQCLEDELGPPPPEPCAFTTDATSEALARIIQANGDHAAVLTGEGRKILAVAKGKYTEGGDIDLWLGGHAGDFTSIHRRSGGPVELPHPCLSALVLTQPDSLQELGEIPAMRESGFLARWLYLCPEPVASEYNIHSIPEATTYAWSKLVRNIMEYPPAHNEDGEPIPHILRMTQDALSVWISFHDETQRHLVNERESIPAILQGWESKMPEHVVRLAGILRIVKAIGNGEPLNTVTGEDMQQAISFVPSLRSHATRAVEAMGANLETARARKVWKWIDRHRAELIKLRKADDLGELEAVKARDIDRAGVAGVANAAEATAVLDLLVSKGWLQEVAFKREGTTSKVQRLFYIRPKVNS
ncbi:MAG: YfjI family protein [Kiritimatiellae bacterium]|jgi:replicative DNA helicase|nr:YfjI family protein [Kiritimatiellia bacterium]